jgi:hypothetical protein
MCFSNPGHRGVKNNEDEDEDEDEDEASAVDDVKPFEEEGSSGLSLSGSRSSFLFLPLPFIDGSIFLSFFKD